MDGQGRFLAGNYRLEVADLIDEIYRFSRKLLRVQPYRL